jgi:hypothetical protein
MLVALALAAGAGEARTIERESAELAFTYRWPEFTPPLPRLAARLAEDAGDEHRKARRNAVETWARDRAESGENPPRHDFEKHWSVAGSTPRLLSLSSGSQFYTGGAHGGIAYDSLLWDRKADRPVRLEMLFTRPKVAVTAMETAYCRQLKADQQERRGEDFRETEFRCPPLATAPLVLTGESRITGFEVLLQPYAAGSWSEGPYEVEVRFTPEMLKAIKPEFRPSFAVPDSP